MADTEELPREVRAKQLITEERVSEALKSDKGDGAEMASFSVEDFTKVGDNYMTYVTSVVVKFSIDGEEAEVTYVVKVNPSWSVSSMDSLTTEMFRKEFHFYEKLLPQLNKILESHEQPKLRTPKMIYGNIEKAQSEILFLEDMREKGFQKFPRAKSLDEAHGRLLLEELARLQAAGHLLLKPKKTEEVLSEFDFLNEWMKLEVYGQTVGPMMEPHIMNGVKVASKREGYERVAEVLTEMAPNTLEIILEHCITDGAFNTICYGDIWNNNFIFRYEEEEPVEVCLLDFQIIRYSSCATDLQMLFFSSFDGPNRKDHFEPLVSAYYAQFEKILECEETAMPFTREELCEEYRSMNRLGLILGVSLIPSVLAKAEDTIEVQDLTQEQLETVMDDYEEKTVKVLEDTAEYNARFFDMFDQLIQEGVFE